MSGGQRRNFAFRMGALASGVVLGTASVASATATGSTVTGSNAHAAPSATARPAVKIRTLADLTTVLERAETAIRAQRTPAKRVTRLGALKDHLESALSSFPSRNPPGDAGAEMRKLRGALSALQGLLAPIDTHAFDPAQCPAYRAQMFLSFSPHDEAPAYVPGEARHALRLLALTCDQPGLAEIPKPETSESPPAPH